jgi:hypothetical protein
MLQNNTDEALQQAGIVLSADEKCALQSFLAIPGQIFTAGSALFSSEPWAVEL